MLSYLKHIFSDIVKMYNQNRCCLLHYFYLHATLLKIDNVIKLLRGAVYHVAKWLPVMSVIDPNLSIKTSKC